MTDYRTQRALQRIQQAGIQAVQRGNVWVLMGKLDRTMTVADLGSVNRTDLDYLAGCRWAYEEQTPSPRSKFVTLQP